MDGVSATGDMIAFTSLDSAPGGTLTLIGGVSAVGTFTATGMGYLTGVTTSDHVLTFVDREGISGS